MEHDNLAKQAEEIEALTSIYGDDWKIESEASRSFSIKVQEGKNEVLLYVTMPEDYPSLSPPKYEMSAPWMDRKAKEQLHAALDEVYLENVGEMVIFQWVEKIREVLQTIKLPEKKNTLPSVEALDLKQVNIREDNDLLDCLWLNHSGIRQLVVTCPVITHGSVILDRKSSFQGHVAEVHSIDDVTAMITKLKQNKKVMNATHNMHAYRIERQTDKGTTMLQDCDDDGETHAGGRMLHLLQILDQRNACVVVSRWYGGIQLGPDRFRHINNATRQVLQEAGMLKK